MFKNHKKAWNNVIFALILAILVCGVSVLVSPKGWEAYNVLAVHRKLRDMQSEPENSLDVMFVGDSESCDVFSPVQLWGEYGIRSYNTASAAQRISDGYAIMQEELKRQNPKLVVIEANTLFRFDDLYNSDQKDEMWMEILVPVTHYHSLYKYIELPSWFPAHTHGWLDAARLKGFWLREKARAYTGTEDYMDRETGSHPMEKGTRAYLQKLVDLCKAKNIRVLFTAAPSPKNWTQARHDEIDRFANENGCYFLDLNKHIRKMGIDWETDSLDHGDHVNFSGSRKVNDYLGSWITKIYDLEDHRGEAGSETWDALYEEVYR
jgi:hypothetical protein